MLIGFVVIYGWITNNSTIVQVYPALAPMQFNTALCFILTGLTTICIFLKFDTTSKLVGLCLTLISGATLLQHIYGFNLHIDNLFIDPFISVRTDVPGRMAPNTALCFLLVSLVPLLTLIKRMRKTFISGIIGSLVFMISSSSLVGYLLGIETAYKWGILTEMALHTAATFFIIGGGLLLFAAKDFWLEPRKAINWFSFTSVCFIFVAVIFIWQSYSQKELIRLRTQIDADAISVANRLQIRLGIYESIIKNSADSWWLHKNDNIQAWQELMSGWRVRIPELTTIGVTEPSGEFSRIVPSSNSAVLKDIVASNFSRISENELFNIVPVRKTNDKNLYILITAKSMADDLSEPIISYGLFNLSYVVDSLFRQEIYNKYNLYISDENNNFMPFTRDIGRKFVENYTWNRTVNLKFRDSIWTVGLELKNLKDASFGQPLLLITLLVGTVLSIVIVTMILFAHKVWLLSKRETKTNIKLKIEMEERALAEKKLYQLNQELEEIVAIRTKDLLEQSQELEEQKKAAINVMYDAEDARKKAENSERELDIKLQELARSNEELAQFAYIASHDLQEPLRKIIALGDILREEINEELNADADYAITTMRESASRMRTLIDDLLTFSKVDRINREMKNVELGQLVNEVLSDINTTINEANASVIFEHLPTIVADRVQMRQLFQNLISNSVKFARKEVPPVVKISGEIISSKAVIKIADNGIGFDMKYANTIFEPFKRLHSREAYKGTGIGLAICQKIIRRHNGTMTVESTPNVGTTFRITLPCSLANNNQTQSATA